MISFDEFLKQDEADKYNMLQECNAIIQQKVNIINGLEKWLVEWKKMLDWPDLYEEGIIDCINDTLTKLQKLKGDSSNE